jgi:hypothetical protein
VIENRFPTLFESRRMAYPRYDELAGALTGLPVAKIERVADDGSLTALDARILDKVDTLIIISFDSFRTGQEAREPRSKLSGRSWRSPTISCVPTMTSATCRIFPTTNAWSVR